MLNHELRHTVAWGRPMVWVRLPPGRSLGGQHWPAASGGSLLLGSQSKEGDAERSSLACISGCPLQKGRSAGPLVILPRGRCGTRSRISGSLISWEDKLKCLPLTYDLIIPAEDLPVDAQVDSPNSWCQRVMSLGSRSNSLLAAYLQIILVYPKMQTGLFDTFPEGQKDNLQLNHHVLASMESNHKRTNTIKCHERH